MKTIADLIAFVVSECKPIDREAAFDESLDAEGDVNVCGLTFAPSRIWREMDPIAHGCGVNDYADGQPWTEVDGGETYEDDAIEAARDEFVDELNDELSTLQGELEDEEAEEDEVRDGDEVNRLTAEIDALEKFIAECESYSF